MDRKAIVEATKQKYKENYLKYGDTPKGVFWNNSKTQTLRFERLLAFFELNEDTSLHDVGCGYGALLDYLKAIRTKCEYSGIEFVPEMVSATKISHPEVPVEEGDFLEGPTSNRYHYLIASGIFNMPGSKDREGWKSYCLAVIKKMFSLADNAIAFNFLTNHTTVPPDPELAYFDPTELFQFCIRELSRFAVIDQGYPLYEVTITVFTSKFMLSRFANPEFSKYFAVRP